MADQPTEIGIARKFRDAAAEAAQLREDNAKLIAQLDELRAGTSTIAPAPKKDGRCYRCVAVYVDQRRRKVTCQTCGTELDALDVLHEFATGERQLLASSEFAKRELADLREQAGRLRADVNAAKAIKRRALCEKCGASIAASDMHPGGIAPHGCYKRRAYDGKVPRKAEERWRVVNDDGASRWCDHVSAIRAAAKADGCRVEEYTGPIGDKAERSVDRAAFEAEWRARMEASRG